MIYVTCTKCGSYLGQARQGDDANTLLREHVVTCEG